MNLPILTHIYTQEDKVYILDKLDKLGQATYSVKTSFESEVYNAFSFFLAESLLESAKSQNVSLTDPQAVQGFLQEVQAAINALPKATVRLAFTPSNDLLRDIAKRFDILIGGKIIVDYVVDPDLIGGVIVEVNGKHLDYSLKKLIREKLSFEIGKEKEAGVSI